MEEESTLTDEEYYAAIKREGLDVILFLARSRPESIEAINSIDGETVEDTARVLSRYVDMVMLRAGTRPKMPEVCRLEHGLDSRLDLAARGFSLRPQRAGRVNRRDEC